MRLGTGKQDHFPTSRGEPIMGLLKRFGERYRKRRKEAIPSVNCEVCRERLDMDRESGEEHCPVCENPEQ